MEIVRMLNMCKITDDSTGKVLVVNRNIEWHGVGFPGGDINLGEGIVSSVKRVVFEKTGLVISNVELCGIKNWYDDRTNERSLIFLFKTNKFTGKLNEISPDGNNYWIDEKDVLKQKTAVDFDILLDVFNNNKFNELIYEDNGNESDLTRWDLKLY